MKQTRLEVKNNSNETLVCIEVRPDESDKKFPAVILAHGFAYFKEEDGIFTELATRLAGQGYAVYYFDFSGCGESEGNYEDTTLTKLIQDLKSVYEYVTRLPYVDAEDISLVSHSFGSNAIIGAQILSAKRMVLSGSFTRATEVLSAIFPDYNPAGISRRTGNGGRITTIGSQFWEDLKHYDMTELIQNYDCPILFVHGKNDDIVPLKYMQPLTQATKHPAGSVILQDSDHDLNPEREQAFAAITQFFTRRLIVEENAEHAEAE